MKEFALLGGVEEHRDKMISRLRLARADAAALAKQPQDRCGFDQVRVLADDTGGEEPLLFNIVTALRDAAWRAGELKFDCQSAYAAGQLRQSAATMPGLPIPQEPWYEKCSDPGSIVLAQRVGAFSPSPIGHPSVREAPWSALAKSSTCSIPPEDVRPGILVVVSQELAESAAHLIDRWENGIRVEGIFNPVQRIVIPASMPRSEIRSQIGGCARNWRRQNRPIAGIQLFGKAIDPLWFVLRCADDLCCFQTDAPYGNWSDDGYCEQMWLDNDMDGFLAEDDFPLNYRQQAWVSRWSGFNVVGQPELDLLEHFVQRRFRRRDPEFDAAIVYLDRDAGFGTYARTTENVREAFPLSHVLHGPTLVPILFGPKGILTKEKFRFLAMFGHGGPNWMADVNSRIVFESLLPRNGPDVIALHGCACALWKHQLTGSILEDSIVFNLLNARHGGPVTVLAYATSPGFYVEADTGCGQTLSQHIASQGNVGMGWLNWVNSISAWLLKDSERRRAIEAVSYGIFGDGTWPIWHTPQQA